MIYFRDSDIPLLINDLAAISGGAVFDVQIGTVAGVGIVDSEDQVFADSDTNPDRSGGIVMSITRITVQTSAFPSLAIDDAVILDGQTYSVRNRARKGDGALTEVYLGTPGNIYDGGFYTDIPGGIIDGGVFEIPPTGAIDGGSY